MGRLVLITKFFFSLFIGKETILFYDNKQVHYKTLSILLNYTDKIRLVKSIRDAYKDIDPTKLNIFDRDIITCIETIQQFLNDIFETGIRKPKQAKLYFEDFDLNEDIKNIVLNLDIQLSDEMVKSYIAKYTLYKNSTRLKELKKAFDDSFDEFSKGSISGLEKKLKKLNNDVFSIYEVAKDMAISNMDDNMSVIVPTDMSKSFGLDDKDSKIEDTNTKRVHTHMWIDNLVGGGFRGGRLYTVCALPGGYKSGFMQNVAEYISSNNKMSDFDMPNDEIPCILYINLEMNDEQISKRRFQFYGEDPNVWMNIPEEDDGRGNTLHDREAEMLRRHGVELPIVYLTEEEGYSLLDIYTKVEELSRQSSCFRPVMIIVDYLDLTENDWSTFRSETRMEPLVAKAVELRKIAKKLRIPILTAAQLNRSGEEMNDRLGEGNVKDIVKNLSAKNLAKAYALKEKVDGLWFCNKYDIEEYIDGEYIYTPVFGIVVDKDRDKLARYKPSKLDKEKEKDVGYTISNKRAKDTRIYYICRLEDFRLSQTEYSNMVKNLSRSSDPSAIEILSTDVDISEIDNVINKNKNKEETKGGN